MSPGAVGANCPPRLPTSSSSELKMPASARGSPNLPGTTRAHASMIPSRMCDACPSCMRRFPGAVAEGFVLFSLGWNLGLYGFSSEVVNHSSTHKEVMLTGLPDVH